MLLVCSVVFVEMNPSVETFYTLYFTVAISSSLGSIHSYSFSQFCLESLIFHRVGRLHNGPKQLPLQPRASEAFVASDCIVEIDLANVKCTQAGAL